MSAFQACLNRFLSFFPFVFLPFPPSLPHVSLSFQHFYVKGTSGSALYGRACSGQISGQQRVSVCCPQIRREVDGSELLLSPRWLFLKMFLLILYFCYALFSVRSRVEGELREWTYTVCPRTGTVPHYQRPHQGATFVTMEEAARRQPSRPVVCITVHAWR